MKTIIATCVGLLSLGMWCTDAGAWASANRFGGSTSHSVGETTHENRWGGGTTHEAGVGTEHANVYGGSTAHSAYGGTEHTNMYGGRTEGEVGAGAYHTYPGGATYYHPPGAYPVYPAYHPPVAVPYYASGCYGCAAAAGAVVGMATGAAIASASSAAASSNAYAAGVAAGSSNTAAATAGAYNAGVAAGAAAATPPGGNYVMGLNYAALPPGTAMIPKNGVTYYLSGNTWFKPSYGANGVYYTVVPTP